MSEPVLAPGVKPKKSVALSGVLAGNTSLCTVGRSGNDLHYRGYDILDFAETSEFEEIAHLLIHGSLPNAAQLKAYKAKLKALRGLPAAVKSALETVPAAAHPMDVMRTGVSALGCALPEPHDHNHPAARDIADRLLASLGSMLLYWHHFSQNGCRIEVETDDDSIGGHFLRLLHGTPPSDGWVRAMHTSLILYAEHEFNASTFTARVIAGTGSDMFSCIAGAIGALRGPKHGGANEVAFEIQKRYANADEAEADIRRRMEAKEVIIGFGHLLRPPKSYFLSNTHNLLVRPSGHHHSIDLRIDDPKGGHAVLLLFRGERPAFTEADVETLTQFEPFLRRAGTAARSRWRSQVASSGHVLVDPETGLIVAISDAAETMLRDSNLVGQGLVLNGPLDAAPRFLVDLCEPALQSGGAAACIDVPAGRLNIKAAVLRSKSSHDQILVTLDHETPSDISLIDPVLAKQLSPLRSELLLFAAAGGARDAVSDAFDISKEATKKHLAEIYRVMDVKRWDELAEALRT